VAPEEHARADSDEGEAAPPAPVAAPRRKRTPSKRKPAAAGDVPVLISKTDDSGNPVETREEHTARLARETHESWHRTYRDWLVHGVIAFVMVAVTLACLYILIRADPQSPPETTKLASTLLTAIVSGGASFFAGKAAGQARPP
jgi:hypothetical protein